MERKDFIKGMGIAGVASLIPFAKNANAALDNGSNTLSTCTLTPTETAGPYPLSGTSLTVSSITRTDMTGGQTGLLLTLTITVQNLSCTPLSGVRIEVWHCNASGYYSGYVNTPGGAPSIDYTSANWLRGSWTTDSNGQVTFTTIYPGWYIPRATHIHAEAYIGSTLYATTQFCFPDAINTTVNTTVSPYSTHGANSTVNATDQVFSDSNNGYTTELLTVTGNSTSGYAASHTFNFAYTTPLELVSFEGGLENGKATLWWATTNEVNADYFDIEKSADGISFSSVGTVNAKNTISTNNYTFTDSNTINGTSFFRLKMIDKDGSYKYSTVVALNNKLTQPLAVNPQSCQR
jgi:protocatechuate 3,4-dioxygenase beta subunit